MKYVETDCKYLIALRLMSRLRLLGILADQLLPYEA